MKKAITLLTSLSLSTLLLTSTSEALPNLSTLIHSSSFFQSNYQILGKGESIHQYLYLTQNTPATFLPYDGEKVQMSLAPQRVLAFEKWGNWYHIQTWKGNMWIKPILGKVEKTNHTLYLNNTTPAHSLPFDDERIATSFAPQNVRVFEKMENWYHIDTWRGPLWIKPILNKIEKTNSTLYLTKNTSARLLPFDDEKIQATFSPQKVQAFEKSGSWYHINTWKGPLWIQYEPISDTTAPKNISNLTYETADTSITLKWENPSDTDFTKVKIYRDNQLIGDTITGEFKDNNLTSSKTYTYKLTTIDQNKNESNGITKTITTLDSSINPPLDNIPPQRISNLSEIHTDTTVTLTWKNPSDNDFSTVKVYRDNIFIGESTTEEFKDQNLTPLATHIYTLISVDQHGNQSEKETKTISLPDLTPPSSIDNLKLVENETNITFTWNNPTDTDFDHVDIIENGQKIGTSTNETYKRLNPNPSTDYAYQFTAVDNHGNTSEIISTSFTTKEATTYLLELDRWNIYNDGTHPIETTKGFNDALIWASQNGKTTFKVPKGNYLVKKGVDFDASARINMVSNMTFLADKEALFQKETNGLTGYSILYVGPKVENSMIKGGKYRGEKDTHDYSISSTHEWGYGILVEGAEHITIDDVETYNFTGDGILVGNTIRKGTYISSTVLEKGNLDENGNPVDENGRIRTVGRTQTNFDDLIYQELNNFYMWAPTGLNKNQFDVYFYKKDGTFIERKINVNMWKGESIVPKDADYFKAVFYSDDVSGRSVYRYVLDNSKDVTIKNSITHDNRRQGITVGGGYGVLIENNEIYNIRGIAPQSGIDLEQGYGINGDITIRNNHIHDNVYGVILYDGTNATVEGNHIVNHSYPGLVVQEGFTGAIINDNMFEKSGWSIKHDATFLNNEMVGGSVLVYGPNVTIDGLKGTDTIVTLASKTPFGISAKNLNLTYTGENNGQLIIQDQPIHLENVNLSGPSKVGLFIGLVAEGSIFDNLQIVGYKLGSDLPRGTYNNCRFESNNTTPSQNGINRDGKFEFNNCAFDTFTNALAADNENADITVKNSSFKVKNLSTYSLGIVTFNRAKNITFVHNVMDVRGNATKDVHLLRIGRSGWQSLPINVANATISNNEFYSDFSVDAISTYLGGTNAQPYTIENNILHKTKLNLKANDINNNNQLLNN